MDVELPGEVIPAIVTLADKLEQRELWPHLSGTIESNSLYWKMAKPKFQYKDTYTWRVNNIGAMTDAKFSREENAFRYLGQVRDIDLDILARMTETGPFLTDMGNEILWGSILDLKETETFDSF